MGPLVGFVIGVAFIVLVIMGATLLGKMLLREILRIKIRP